MNTDDVRAQVAATRAELEHTLDSIEERLDVKKRATELAERARASYERNPVPWIAGATGVVVAVAGIIAWAIFSDD